MGTATSQRESIPNVSRLITAVGTLGLLGVIFVLPLCAVLMLCGMPCCHHGNQGGMPSFVSAEIAACQNECAVREEQTASATLPDATPESKLDHQATVVIAVGPAVASLAASIPDAYDVVPLDRTAATPLHVLNSTFRI